MPIELIEQKFKMECPELVSSSTRARAPYIATCPHECTPIWGEGMCRCLELGGRGHVPLPGARAQHCPRQPDGPPECRVRGGFLYKYLGGVSYTIRILMYPACILHVSCMYSEGYMYPECILMYLKCILHALLHSKRIHVS